MDIHPLIVHFPIAFLGCYVVLELVPFSRWYSRMPWDSIKTFLVIFGTVGAMIALGTGSLAEENVGGSLRNVVEMHQSFATITTSIFGILAVTYLIQWLFREHATLLRFAPNSVALFGKAVSDFVLQRWLVVFLSLIGLIALGVTGALGGIIVYGPDLDPFTRFVYSLIFNGQ